MKRISLGAICSLLILYFSVSCENLNRNEISLTVSENEQYVKVLAHYNKEQTRAVENYMQDKLGRNSNISFINTVIDAQLTLDDGTKFYMKKHPGDLAIKFNKDENSAASYKEIKAFAEGLKPVIK